MSAGLEWNCLNASVHPKHECAVLDLISLRRIEKEELVHKWWPAPASLIQWEVRMSTLSNFHVNNKTIVR